MPGEDRILWRNEWRLVQGPGPLGGVSLFSPIVPDVGRNYFEQYSLLFVGTENGQISFNRDPTKRGTLYNITDETKAYQNARLGQGGLGVNVGIDDDWTRSCLPYYENLPKGPININSKAGKTLRQQTQNEGKTGTSNSEFYKGWQKDYKKIWTSWKY